MDLVAACRVFVHVGERGSFTGGAAAARVPQSVASRRVQALEAHLGQRLFDRSARRPALTGFGRDMLPVARRLVEVADATRHDADLARLRPLTLAVPPVCGVRELAALDAGARDNGLVLEFRDGTPAERVAMARAGHVRAALAAVPAAGARWLVPLGVATDGPAGPDGPGFRVETLRTSRSDRSARTLWLQPEDDVPHVRDEAEREGHRRGLLPGQVRPGGTLTAAVSRTISSQDLLLCSRAQADTLGLAWRPLRAPALVRGYAVVAADGEDAQCLHGTLAARIASCLGGAVRPRDPSRPAISPPGGRA